MEIIAGIDQLKRPLNNPIVTLGNFDGVHLGHQAIFRKVKGEAQKNKSESVVITFEPHPLKVLSPNTRPPLLTPFRQKMMLIEKTGIETVLCIEFTLSFSRISPFDFIKNILIEKVKPKKIVVGYDYHFGWKHRGDVEILRRACKFFHVDVEVVEPLRIGTTTVSSSRIRALIKEGEVEEASKLLGRNYSLIGKVIPGARRGQTLGFPTANLELTEELYPKKGVYAVEVVWNKQLLNGVADVGMNPTFLPVLAKEGTPLSVEVHILNFHQDLYGEEIEVNFKKRIRDETRFNSPAELMEQIRKDVEWASINVFHIQER